MSEITDLQAAKKAARETISGTGVLLRLTGKRLRLATKKLLAPTTLKEQAEKTVKIPRSREVWSQKVQMAAFRIGSRTAANIGAFAIKGTYGLIKGALGFQDRVAVNLLKKIEEEEKAEEASPATEGSGTPSLSTANGPDTPPAEPEQRRKGFMPWGRRG